MSHLDLILKNTSLWEIIALIVVVYFLFHPSLLKNITRLKIGDLEIELNKLKKQVDERDVNIQELESELESERMKFEDLIDNFDPNAPLKDLAEIRKKIITNAKNLEEVESLKQFLSLDVKPEDLYVAAVAIRERRPTILIPEITSFLSQLAEKKDLGGYRLNIVWTLTSALHLSLLSAIRDRIEPIPKPELLLKIENVLDVLEKNPRVENDNKEKPMKGINGPIKHCRSWVKKGFDLYKGGENT